MDDLPLIDAHAHVWDRTCTYVDGSRYRPDYEATIGDYLRLLDAHGIERAVLVQPSFLGTDNGYMLRAASAHPDRLRAIAVVNPGVTAAALDDMAGGGVIGIRYNLLSLPPEALATPPYRALTARAAAMGWWIEVQANGRDWPAILPHLTGVRLMVDHFGKPSGPDCPGFRAILGRDPASTCVKLSAPYRQAMPDMAPFARALIDRFGPGRCLWGSDWPWTQHEGAHDYAQSRHWLTEWTTRKEREAMAGAAPALCGFAEG